VHRTWRLDGGGDDEHGPVGFAEQRSGGSRERPRAPSTGSADDDGLGIVEPRCLQDGEGRGRADELHGGREVSRDLRDRVADLALVLQATALPPLPGVRIVRGVDDRGGVDDDQDITGSVSLDGDGKRVP
jgi:hypothetical protein